MRIPANTHRYHLHWSDPRCDTLAFLNMAARRGYLYVDCNACLSADGTSWNLHWATGPKHNHFDWYWTGRRNRFGREIRRPMTQAELDWNVDEWTDAQIRRWRTAERGGRRPATVYKRQRQAKRRGLIICWELKTRTYGRADYADRLVDDVERSGHPAFYMTLVTMANWGPKLRAVHEAGGRTALLAHGAPRPRDLDKWLPYIDRVWGRFA